MPPSPGPGWVAEPGFASCRGRRPGGFGSGWSGSRAPHGRHPLPHRLSRGAGLGKPIVMVFQKQRSPSE